MVSTWGKHGSCNALPTPLRPEYGPVITIRSFIISYEKNCWGVCAAYSIKCHTDISQPVPVSPQDTFPFVLLMAASPPLSSVQLVLNGRLENTLLITSDQMGGEGDWVDRLDRRVRCAYSALSFPRLPVSGQPITSDWYSSLLSQNLLQYMP